ncbi:MAG: amiC [Massilibacillus sp.]|nr:amiC [Massilibacillus sp.]
MRKSIILWLVLVCFIASPAIVFASDFSDRISGLVKVQGVRVYSNGDSKVRVVLDSSGPVEYKTFVLSNPNRIAVDIKGAWLSPTADKVTMVEGGLVGKVRISQFDPTTVRVVVEANVSKDRYKVFQLKENPAANKSNRIVMDFGDLAQDDTPKAATVEEATIAAVPDADKVVTKTIKLFDTPGLKDKIIAIDPGHGGSDPGAVGPHGITEKEITLAVGLELKKMLENEGAKVIMTRISDVDVAYANATAKDELQARADIANNAKADVFVSIHMNAFVNTQVKGTATYYYPKTNGDERIARFVREGLISQLGTDDRAMQTCNFYVVKHTTMPATLAEVAFVSNPVEEQLLKSTEGTKKAATGIFRGLDRYFSYE